MTQKRKIFHLPEIPNLRNTGSSMNRDSEGMKMPLSVTDRVTHVRNNMHQAHLRQAKEKLHNEINKTMKMYSSEKHHLLKQLASLRHDLTDLKLPEIASQSNTQDPYLTPRLDPKQYMMERRKPRKGTKYTSKTQTSSKKLVDKCETETSDYESDFEKSTSDNDQNLFADDNDTENDVLNSTIQDDQSLLNAPCVNLGSTQWYSGKNLRHSSLGSATTSQTIDSQVDTVHHSQIPSVQDSQRSEIKLPTIKGLNKKKVKFDGKTAVKLIPIDQRKESRADKIAGKSQGKRSEKLPSIEGWKIKKAARGQMRGRKSPTGSYFPLSKQGKQKRSMDVIPETLAESAEWKALYLNIHDRDKRNKTLSDILHAVRIRMHHNEHSLKFGERRSPEKTDNLLCDYLLNSQSNHTNEERPRRNLYPSHAAERCFRRSNAVHLQNYLHKLSRQRRMIEHMAGEEYRLTHIVGHKHLQDALPM